VQSNCGNSKTEKGEQCDCGTDPSNLPSGCKAVNGLFYGDGKGCSKTCTKEPNCLDSSGKTQACSATCGDGNIDPSEECDDGNQASGDGCSSTCKKETGFTCTDTTSQDSSTCQSGSGQCLELPITYRDFQPENVASGGHPDFFFLGAKKSGSTGPTTICVPNSGGPAKGNDSTARCWGILASSLLNGKPQPGTTTTCSCQFSDWNIANSSRIPGNYTQAGNDSPLSDGKGGFLGGAAGTAVSVTGNAGVSSGTLTGYTSSSPGGPIWKGTTPAYKDANSLKQWFNDDSTVNKTYTGVLEMTSIGTNVYQFASKSHLAQGGFFPLDTLNTSQVTTCYLWPYWNHGDGTPIWTNCTGDQYLFPPRIISTDMATCDPPITSATDLTKGCWQDKLPSQKHDNYFTDEARYYFVYDGTTGISLSFFGDDDLYIFINGVLVLDLGGVHQQLPGKVDVSDKTNGDASVTEGGCLDSAGNITGVTVGSTACSPTNSTPAPPTAKDGDDFHVHNVKLGLTTGKIYEIAIFGADRHPPESNYQLTLNGFTTKHSACTPHCGDGIATNGEQCDCGDGSQSNLPDGCTTKNDDSTYGGCTTNCKYGPFCGDGTVNGPEECDLGKRNGDTSLGKEGCSIGCLKPHFCGDGIVDTDLKEECDMKDLNGKTVDSNDVESNSPDAVIKCTTDCAIPPGIVW
jgi:fibro-slime domain-containing protein